MELSALLRETVTLATARGRICAWLLLSAAIFFAPYGWLSNLSLWQRIGWEGAPSIGLTRAYWLLLHGQPAAAWQRNRLIVPVLLVGLTLLAVDALKLLRGRQSRVKDLH